MWPDSPFAGPRGSFLRPVPLPTHSPDDGGQVSVSVACDWLPWIRGALQQLLLQSTWQTTDPAALLQVQEWVFTLIDLFADGACSSGPAFACPFDFTATDSGWEVDPAYGVGAYTGGVGFTGTYNGPTNQSQCIIINVGGFSGDLNALHVEYDGGAAVAGPDNIVNVFYDIGSGLVNIIHHALAAGPGSDDWTGDISSTGAINVVIELNSGSAAGPVKITKVVLNGRSFGPPC